jgi:hypothetical protein
MITLLSILACALGMTGQYLVSQGYLRPVYWLMIVNGGCYTTLNVSLATASVEQRGMWFLAVPSAWMMIAGVLGLRRLRKPRG